MIQLKPGSLLNVNAANPVVREHPLNVGMVGWWLALPSNVSQNYLYDLGGKWHGTMSNPIQVVGADRPGSFNTAQSFVWSSTAQQRIALPDISGQFPNSEGTISVWMKRREATPSNPNGTLKTGWGWLGIPTSGGSDSLYTYFDGLTYLGFMDNGRPISGVNIPNRTNWNHCTVVSKSGTNNYKLYINGKQFAQATRGTFGMTSTPTFGGSRINGTTAHDGLADDWRIWNRGFSAAEVYALYQESLAGYPNMLRRNSMYIHFVTSTAPSAIIGGMSDAGIAQYAF